VRVLITGASGFIGRRLALALREQGHGVVCVLRHPAAASTLPCERVLQGDFARDQRAGDWRPRLAGIDVVVNAAGILRERRGQRFDDLHVRGPCALFEACVDARVRRVVQLSALGADAAASSRYHRSKKAADDFLLRLPLDAVVAQPSLVYGPGGASARLFTLLASLPLVPLPGRGAQEVQPIFIDDLVAALLALVQGRALRGQRVPLVGPRPLALRELLDELRDGLGLPRARFVPVPIGLVRLAAAFGAWCARCLLDREALAMLERGNTGSARATELLLRRAPRAPREFVDADQRAATLIAARLAWLLPLLRGAVALLWIGTAIVSFGLYPVADSLELLRRVGIPAGLAPTLLYAAAALDLAFGIATLALARRRRLYFAQLGLLLFYSAVIAWRLPEFWLHPFGPMLKNLPLAAALVLLLVLDGAPRSDAHE
jgi:nucleoside-diphosphate-sugar epimerase